MKSSERITEGLMKKIRSMNDREYNEWLMDGIDLTKKMLKLSDLYFIEKQRKEAKLDAYFHAIHCGGGCQCESSKKHNKS